MRCPPWRRRSPRAPGWLVLKHHLADVHGVAFAGARSLQGAVDTQTLQAMTHVVLGVGCGDVRQGNRPLRGTADDAKVASRVALDAEALRERLVEHERAGNRYGGPGLLHPRGQLTDERAHALAGDGRDPLALPR